MRVHPEQNTAPVNTAPANTDVGIAPDNTVVVVKNGLKASPSPFRNGASVTTYLTQHGNRPYEFPRPLAASQLTLVAARRFFFALALCMVVSTLGYMAVLANELGPQVPFIRGCIISCPLGVGVIGVSEWRSIASWGLPKRAAIWVIGFLIAFWFNMFAAFPAIDAHNGHTGILFIFPVALVSCVMVLDAIFIGTAFPTNKTFSKAVGPLLGSSWAFTAAIFLLYTQVYNAFDSSVLQGVVSAIFLLGLCWVYEKGLTKFFTFMYMKEVYWKYVGLVVRLNAIKEAKAKEGLQQEQHPHPIARCSVLALRTEVYRGAEPLFQPTQEEIQEAVLRGILDEGPVNLDISPKMETLPPIGDMEMVISYNIMNIMVLAQTAKFIPQIVAAYNHGVYVPLTITTNLAGVCLEIFTRLGWINHLTTKITGGWTSAFKKCIDEHRFFLNYPQYFGVISIGLAKYAIVTGDPWDIVLGPNVGVVLLVSVACSIFCDILNLLTRNTEQCRPPRKENNPKFNPNHPEGDGGLYFEFRDPSMFIYFSTVSFSFTSVVFLLVLRVGFDPLFNLCPTATDSARGFLWWWPLPEGC